MKYRVEDFRDAEQKTVDVRDFIPSAEGPVLIKIRRYSEKTRAELQAMMMRGQTVDQAGNVTVHDSSWILKQREKMLLEAVVVDEEFPFERWDAQVIEAIGRKCPEFIDLLVEEIRRFNSPLAEKSEER